MLEFILCDDQKRHNTNLKKAIEKILKKRQLEGSVVYVTENPEDVINYSKQNKGRPNVYFLDIDFSDGEEGEIDGVRLAKKIRENEVMAYIIFVSAHPEYALLCYKVKAFDFLLKPLTLKVLDRCVVNLFDDYKRMKKLNRQTIPVKSGSKIHLVKIEDIIYIEKLNNIAVFHTKNGILRTYASLNDIQEQIGDHGFYRCHKSFIVNLSQIEYFSISQNYLQMKNKKKVLVSRNNKKEMMEIVECCI